MTIAITIIFLTIPFLAVGLYALLRSRKLMREAKGFERGLKMVPMHIHLPPVSDDIESGARDSRDVVDENTSKAQVLYNIIATTATKEGFKSGIYGQRHISLEIIAKNGFVYFYTAVPVALVSVVQQAIVSAYPKARIEEAPDKNIFNEVGKITGTIGGDLVLKENFAYPIATYQETKRDAMQSLLSALATLEKEDGAGIQILIRPARKSWTKDALAIASKKRKGEDKKKGIKGVFASWGRDALVALVKPPENKQDSKDGKPKELSGVDQAIIEAIESKTQHPGFEVLIRVIVSSNVSQRAQAIHSNIVASFALFEAPGRNGFKHVEARNIEAFVTGFIMRFFPPENNKNILNSVELATLFHFPNQESIPTTQLERQTSKQVDGPRNMPEDGLVLGYNVFRGTKKKIVLTNEDRMRHVYIIGQTGVGKSVLLENIALQDMLNGNGFAFVDPHGDTAEKLLSMVPKERTEDVIYFNPADMDYPMGLNMFEFDDPDQKDFLVQEGLNMLYKLYDPQRQGIIGPRYEHLFRNAALAIMADPAGGTFIDIPKLFNDQAYVDQKLQHVTDQTVLDFWQKEMPDSRRSNEFGEVKSWFVSKFSAFLGNEMMRNIIGQPKSALNFRDIMDNKKILIVNLSKGKTGELNSKLLGMIFVIKFQIAAMSRASMNPEDRTDFTLYVDEFQNFATDSFASILSEARKYRLSLIVANQFTTQLTDEVRDAIYGNVGSAISFRLSAQDAENMVKQFYSPIFEIDDLTRLPVGNTAVRMLLGGVPTQPFSMATLPPLGHQNPELKDALIQLSAAKYGRPRATVDAEIKHRLEAIAPQPSAAQPGGGQAQPRPAAPTTGSSFLDEWINKRNTGYKAPSARPFQTPTPTQTPAAPVPSQMTTQNAPQQPQSSSQIAPSLQPPASPVQSSPQATSPAPLTKTEWPAEPSPSDGETPAANSTQTQSHPDQITIDENGEVHLTDDHEIKM